MEIETSDCLMSFDASIICIRPSEDIRKAITCIDQNQKGIILATDANRHLLGTLTDGDIRRAILAGATLETPIQTLLDRKKQGEPISAPLGMDPSLLLKLMQEKSIRQIPLLDAENRVAGLVTIDELELVPSESPFQAVIMAGGFGKRLHPLTEDLPKPMLPVGEKPIMELIMEQLRQSGVKRVNVTTHFQPEKIMTHFGNGETFGVEINYVSENLPLGTAGALRLLEKTDSPLLVINGDVLTRTDFRAMLHYHHEHRAVLTVAVRKYEIEVPYGVIESADGVAVSSIKEKPRMHFFVNAGIYLLEPAAHQFVPAEQRFDMTDLILALIRERKTVVSFPIIEYWLDIGQHEDYEKAQNDYRNGNFHGAVKSLK